LDDAVFTIRGHHHVLQLNGRTTIEFTDENGAQRVSSGGLAFGLWIRSARFTGVQYKTSGSIDSNQATVCPTAFVNVANLEAPSPQKLL